MKNVSRLCGECIRADDSPYSIIGLPSVFIQPGYDFYIFAGFLYTINMDLIRQCAILFGCLAVGEWVVHITGVSLPSSIIGMLLLTFLLKIKVIRLGWVKGMADFLIANLGFFFVPPGVALMLYFDIIQAEFWPIVAAVVGSTIIVLIVTGQVHQLIRRGYGLFRK